MRVVLDTNVLVSALLNRYGNEAVVLAFALAGKCELAISPAVLAEYALVLPRPRFEFSPTEVHQILAAVRQAGELVHPSETVTAASDDADNRFLECAEAAEAGFLVTGNLKHFPTKWGKTRIVRARTVLELIRPNDEG